MADLDHTLERSHLSFRVRSDFKKALGATAPKEARSVPQVCEAILQDGVNAYREQGTKYLQSRTKRLSTGRVQ
jgi:hypothetical protein